MRRALTIAGVYIGSVIGAGFSSGQELLRFFAAFGTSGLWGIGAAGMMFFALGAIVVDRAYVLRTTSHQDLLYRLCGNYLGALVDTLLNLFIFGTLGAMLAAAGTLLHDLYALPFTLGVTGMALLTREMVRRGPDRLLSLNGLLVVVLLAITVGLLVPVAMRVPFPTQINAPDLPLGMVPKHWFVGAVLYVTFNVALALSPLGALGDVADSRRSALLGSAIGGVGLGAVGALLVTVLLQHFHHVGTEDLPILAVLRQQMPGVAPLYALALFFAILTSCVAAAYGLGKRIGDHGWLPNTMGWVPVLAIPIAYVGFGNLVQTLYPLLGYVGLAVVALGALRRSPTRIG